MKWLFIFIYIYTRTIVLFIKTLVKQTSLTLFLVSRQIEHWINFNIVLFWPQHKIAVAINGLNINKLSSLNNAFLMGCPNHNILT